LHNAKKYCLFLKALICFGNISASGNNYCDVFDGSTAVSTFSSRYSHMGGGLGYYNWNPTTVGSLLSDGSRKVETLNEDGWTSLDDFPEYVFPLLCSLRISRNTYAHNIVGLSNGDMVVLGGIESGRVYSDRVWKLSNGSGWTQIGNLNQVIF